MSNNTLKGLLVAIAATIIGGLSVNYIWDNHKEKVVEVVSVNPTPVINNNTKVTVTVPQSTYLSVFPSVEGTVDVLIDNVKSYHLNGPPYQVSISLGTHRLKIHSNGAVLDTFINIRENIVSGIFINNQPRTEETEEINAEMENGTNTTIYASSLDNLSQQLQKSKATSCPGNLGDYSIVNESGIPLRLTLFSKAKASVVSNSVLVQNGGNYNYMNYAEGSYCLIAYYDKKKLVKYAQTDIKIESCKHLTYKLTHIGETTVQKAERLKRQRNANAEEFFRNVGVVLISNVVQK